jgi:hypothetical protein
MRPPRGRIPLFVYPTHRTESVLTRFLVLLPSVPEGPERESRGGGMRSFDGGGVEQASDYGGWEKEIPALSSGVGSQAGEVSCLS